MSDSALWDGDSESVISEKSSQYCPTSAGEELDLSMCRIHTMKKEAENDWNQQLVV